MCGSDFVKGVKKWWVICVHMRNSCVVGNVGWTTFLQRSQQSVVCGCRVMWVQGMWERGVVRVMWVQSCQGYVEGGGGGYVAG